MDIREQISYLCRSGSSAEDVECAETMEKLLAENHKLKLAVTNLIYPDMMMEGIWIQHYCRDEDITYGKTLVQIKP